MRTLAALALAAASHASAAAERLPLDAVRIAAPVELRRGEQVIDLGRGAPLLAGDRIVTAPQGRIALRLAGGGQLRLGGDSALYLHSAEAPEIGRGGIARLVLERGALRLDARVPSPQLPQDYRLNIGRLHLRVFGSEAWAELTPRGENICLLSGALEIDSDAGAERLDQPGQCVLFGSGGNRLLVQADTGEALPRKLLRTAFAGDIDARFAADRAPATKPVAPAPAAAAALPEAAAAAPTPGTAPAAARPRWTLVLASFPDAAAAEAAVQRWQARGETPQLRRSETPSGARYRLTQGEFEELGEARAALARLRSSYFDAADAWLMPLQE